MAQDRMPDALPEGCTWCVAEMTDADSSASPNGGELERRLLGVPLPDLELDCADEAPIHLPELARRSNLAIFFYRGLTGAPPDLRFSDDARALEWVDHDYELDKLGYLAVGISVQSVAGQAKLAGGEPLPYMLLSDPKLQLADALDLPAIEGDFGPAYEPLTMLVREERISRIFFPIDPDCDASSVVEWIKREMRP